MLKTIFVVGGVIWFLIGSGALIIGPLVGFDRSMAGRELMEFYAEIVKCHWLIYLLKLSVFWVAYLGFLLPATNPFIGIVLGITFIFIGAAI